MAAQKSGLSQIHERSKLNTPDHATCVADLTKLRLELHAAKRMDSPNREAIVRQKIDRKLEDLYRCVDPAGVASVAEWGAAG